MPEAERQKLLQRYARFKQLPPERQKKIRTRYDEFMRLPPEEREKRLELLEETHAERSRPPGSPASGADKGGAASEATKSDDTDVDTTTKPDVRHKKPLRQKLKKLK